MGYGDEFLAKYNMYHDELGRFTFAESANWASLRNDKAVGKEKAKYEAEKPKKAALTEHQQSLLGRVKALHDKNRDNWDEGKAEAKIREGLKNGDSWNERGARIVYKDNSVTAFVTKNGKEEPMQTFKDISQEQKDGALVAIARQSSFAGSKVAQSVGHLANAFR